MRGCESNGMLDYHALWWKDRMRQAFEPLMTPQKEANDASWEYHWSGWWGWQIPSRTFPGERCGYAHRRLHAVRVLINGLNGRAVVNSNASVIMTLGWYGLTWAKSCRIRASSPCGLVGSANNPTALCLFACV
jgi:hypothetical protein